MRWCNFQNGSTWIVSFLVFVILLDYGDAAQSDHQKSTSFTTSSNTGIYVPTQYHHQYHRRRTWTKEAYPNPMQHPLRCRSRIGCICDPDGMLLGSSYDDNNDNDETVHEQLEMKLRSFSQYTYDYYSRGKISHVLQQQQQQKQQPVHIQIYVAFVRKMDWSKNDDDTMNTTNTTTTSTFHVAEAFARYIYHQWITTPTTMRVTTTPQNNSTIQNASFSLYTVEQPQIYKMLLFIAKEDQMVYIARPIHNHHHQQQQHQQHSPTNNDPMNDPIAAILTSVRLERLLLQHMMIHLQHGQYDRAIQEFMSGIDFYMKYGPPKVFFWEQILKWTLWNHHHHHHYQEQIYWMFILLLISMALVSIFWYPLLQLYERYMYHDMNHYYEQWFQNYHPIRYHWWFQSHVVMMTNIEVLQPLTSEEYIHAEQLRQKYHVQDSCPICLEQFTKSSTPPSSSSSTMDMDKLLTHDDNNQNKNENLGPHSYPMPHQYGSDHQPITILRCGHVYDTTCWKKWIRYHYRQYHHHPPRDNHMNETHNQQQLKLKCIICQQPA